MTINDSSRTTGPRAASTAELASTAAAQISTLVGDELALAKAEKGEQAAGPAALLSKKQLAKGGPLVPQQTVASVETDVQTVKNAAQRGRHA